MKPYLLSPDKQPMENLWDCIDYCCRSILKNKKLLLTSEERDEILGDWSVRAFIRFRQRVLNGNYDRSYALWQNVFYSCWGTWSAVWRPTKRQIINKINTTSLDTPVKLVSDCSAEDASAYNELLPNNLSTKLNYKHDYNDLEARHGNLAIPEQRDVAYDMYLEECYDLCVTPVDLETYVIRNGGKPEWADPKRTFQDYHKEVNKEYRERKRMLNKQWYDSHKEDPAYQEKRRKSRKLYNAKRKAQRSSSSSNMSVSTGSPLSE